MEWKFTLIARGILKKNIRGYYLLDFVLIEIFVFFLLFKCLKGPNKLNVENGKFCDFKIVHSSSNNKS